MWRNWCTWNEYWQVNEQPSRPSGTPASWVMPTVNLSCGPTIQSILQSCSKQTTWVTCFLTLHPHQSSRQPFIMLEIQASSHYPQPLVLVTCGAWELILPTMERVMTVPRSRTMQVDNKLVRAMWQLCWMWQKFFGEFYQGGPLWEHIHVSGSLVRYGLSCFFITRYGFALN